MWRRLISRDASRAWQVNKVATTASAGEHITMHRVRLRPAKSVFRRAVGYGTTAVVCFWIWDAVAYYPLRNLDAKVLEELDKEEEEAVEPTFIPLPFTEKEVQPLPYAGSGEEWQEFIKFNSDDERRQSVKSELRLLVKKSAEGNPVTKMWTNSQEGFKLGPSFLICSYPARPPPEYIQWGIEINDDGIELKTRTLEPRTKALLDRVIMPYPMISASYAFAKALVKQNVDAVTKYFGYTPADKTFTTTSIDPELAKALKKLEARQATHGGPGSSSGSASRSSPSTPEPGSLPNSGDVSANTASPGREPNKPANKDILPFSSTLLGEFSGPWHAFREKFLRTWKPLHCYPPRGSLGIHGIVTLDGPKGRVYIDVFAWYHPKTCEFHRDSLIMRLRSVSPRRQVPLRQ